MSKAAFVKAFSDFLKENVPYYEDIDGLVYVEKKGDEWVYVNYRSYSQKRINVAADSETGIMIDFFRHENDAPWITPIDEEIYNMSK
ncbi:MAG TPA: hypothetical protein PK891_01430 [Bacteroidales bacterium]|nr:hypothetical protein [Bacteroidales bacterium]